MIKKKLYYFLLLFATSVRLQAQIENTSFVNSAGERVLRQEFIMPVDMPVAWTYFTQDSLLKKWVAPQVHIELRAGGYRIANYDPAKSLSDSSSIRLPLINFLEPELMTLKVNLNASFPPATRAGDQYLQFILQLKKIDENHTRVIGTMVGWGKGPDWDKAYQFLERGNEWTFQKLLKLFK